MNRRPTDWASTPTRALLRLALDASDLSGEHRLAAPAMAARKIPIQFQAEQPLQQDNPEIDPHRHQDGPRAAHGRETTLEWLLKTPRVIPVENHLLFLQLGRPLTTRTDIPVNVQALAAYLEAAAKPLPPAGPTFLILTLARWQWPPTLPTPRHL